MIYNFDQVRDREGKCSFKYDERARVFGTKDVLPLWVADMDFQTAQPIIDAVKKKAEEGIWGYTSRPDSYFEAVCQWQKRRHGWEIDPGLVSWCLGVVPALSALVRIFTDPGDKVLIQTPVYPQFYSVTEDWGRTVLENPLVETASGWAIDFADFERKAKEARMFLLCSPQNPLGIVWPEADLRKMAEICIANDVLLVSDEIHSDLVFHGKKHIPTAALSGEIAAHVISCISGTKTFNLAGLQSSATVFPNAAYKAEFDRFWGRLDVSMNNSFSVVAMEAAFREGEEWLEQLLPYLDGNFRYVKSFCETHIPQVRANLPDATYLMWLDFRALGLDNQALRRFLIEKAGLGLNDGSAFARNLSGFMRLNAACPRSVLERAMHQLKAAVESL